ncbi:MAG: prolyl-tRNA synthetase associated domain-containing protein [Beijerinckiaceae bacterium]
MIDDDSRTDSRKAAAEEALFAAFARLGITTTTQEHQAVFTVEEGDRLFGQRPDGHTKNLFVKDKKGRFFLITARQHARIDLKRVHEVIGASGRVSFGAADQLMALLGVEPGSVTAFAVINDTAGAVTMVLDEGLLAAPTLYGHPLRNTATTAIARDDLVRFLAATGHDPMIVTLPEPLAPAV